MRKILIRLFVLNYILKCGKNTVISYTRDAPVTIGIVLLMIPILMFNLFNWLYLFPPLLIITYFAFVHFSIWPARYNELSDCQKWQYGRAIKSGELTEELTDINWNEWEIINKNYIKKYK